MHCQTTNWSNLASRILSTAQVYLAQYAYTCILDYYVFGTPLFAFIVPYGNHGCSGGDTYTAIKYVVDNGGIDTESTYGFKGKVK